MILFLLIATLALRIGMEALHPNPQDVSANQNSETSIENHDSQRRPSLNNVSYSHRSGANSPAAVEQEYMRPCTGIRHDERIVADLSSQRVTDSQDSEEGQAPALHETGSHAP